MEALEIRHLRLVASLDQDVEAGHDQVLEATTEHCLLTEQVGDSLGLEGGRDNASACATDCGSVGQRKLTAVALRILLHGDQARHTLAVGEGATHQVARTLRGNHADGDVVCRLDQAEMDVQTMPKEQGVAVLQVRLDVLFEDLGLGGIRGEQHDHVSPCSCLSIRLHIKAGLAGLFCGLGAVAKANNHLDAGLAQVLSVRVTLGAVADDCNLLALDQGQVCVLVVKHFNSHSSRFFLHSVRRAFHIMTQPPQFVGVFSPMEPKF